jgi:hypothetical protein
MHFVYELKNGDKIQERLLKGKFQFLELPIYEENDNFCKTLLKEIILKLINRI